MAEAEKTSAGASRNEAEMGTPSAGKEEARKKRRRLLRQVWSPPLLLPAAGAAAAGLGALLGVQSPVLQARTLQVDPAAGAAAAELLQPLCLSEEAGVAQHQAAQKASLLQAGTAPQKPA